MHIVSGLIRKAPFIKQLESSTMFVIELAECVKDYKTGEKSYSNYKAMLFAKSPAAVDYYTTATREGGFIVLSCEKLKVEKFDADNGTQYITLMMDNARLENAMMPAQGQPNIQPPQQQQRQPQQPNGGQSYHPQQGQQQQAQPQYNEPPVNYDDDIPF